MDYLTQETIKLRSDVDIAITTSIRLMGFDKEIMEEKYDSLIPNSMVI